MYTAIYLGTSCETALSQLINTKKISITTFRAFTGNKAIDLEMNNSQITVFTDLVSYMFYKNSDINSVCRIRCF